MMITIASCRCRLKLFCGQKVSINHMEYDIQGALRDHCVIGDHFHLSWACVRFRQPGVTLHNKT